MRETRGGASFFYFATGDHGRRRRRRASRTRSTRCCASTPATTAASAVDKIQLHGLRALEAQGFELLDGEEMHREDPLDQRPRRHPRHALRRRTPARSALHAMDAAAEPGQSENEIWAVLHAENIRRGGEWIETRLMASGPRTNPWFQECGPRVIVQASEICWRSIPI